MKNVTISLPEELYESLRDDAAKKKTSLNKLVREKLAESYGAGEKSPAEKFAELARELGPAPKSWKFNREELYEEIMRERKLL